MFRKAFYSRSVRRCDCNTLRCIDAGRPIAGLGLLFHHVLLQSWTSTGDFAYKDEAQQVLDSLLEEFPGAIARCMPPLTPRRRRAVSVLQRPVPATAAGPGCGTCAACWH